MTSMIPGSVTIADLYRELVGMRSDLTRVLAHQEATDLINRGADLIHADHESRLRMLERFRYTLAGLAVIGGAVSGYVGYLVGHFAHLSLRPRRPAVVIPAPVEGQDRHQHQQRQPQPSHPPYPLRAEISDVPRETLR